uniref:Ig-like domain-containing protein n=1 Tax=Salarias fasciatus TaxID=181472 RepID=A0A672JTJ0_SALFA
CSSGRASLKTAALTAVFKLKNQEAVEEGYVTLRCELSKSGVPVEWRKDAQLLKEGEKYQMKQEGRVAEMLIGHLSMADAGQYSCFVGTAETSADIKVRGGPTGGEGAAFHSAEEGDTASLSCELSKPGVSVQWKKNKLPLRASRKYEMKQDGCVCQLDIRELRPEDRGSYSCHAGTAETTAVLSVIGQSFR